MAISMVMGIVTAISMGAMSKTIVTIVSIGRLHSAGVGGRSLVWLRRRCLLAVDARRLRLDLPLKKPSQFQDGGRPAAFLS